MPTARPAQSPPPRGLVEQNTSKSRAHIPALDGVRGLAILAVLIAHTVPEPQGADMLPRCARAVIHSGVFGVDLFFVLSGFLITGILLDSKGRKAYFTNFYARRFLRLFPVYYGYLLLLATLAPMLHRLVHTSMPDYRGSWWWYLGYFANWKRGSATDPYLGQFWSLAVEEQFYLLWPSAVYLLSRRNLARLCVALCALSVAVRCTVSGLDTYRVTIARMDSLALGALVALAVRDQRWMRLLDRFWRTALAAAAAAFVVVTYLEPSDVWTPLNAFAAAVLFAILVFRASQVRTGTLHRVLTSRALMRYGVYSYCIYVIHPLIADHADWLLSWAARRLAIVHPEIQQALVFVAANLAIYLIAALSWRYYESPFMRLKRRFGS
jgi:peptidoglycan/LPS O-acetylase OafA/YrhL